MSGTNREQQLGQLGEEEAEAQGPEEIFLDDADIEELKKQLEEDEGDYPMDEDDEDDVVDMTGQEEAEENGDDEDLPADTSSKQFLTHGKAIFTVTAHPSCPDLVVSGGEDELGYLWRLDTGEEIAKLTGHTDSVVATGWSADGELVATGGMDGRVRVWRRVKPASSDQWEWGRWEFLTVLEGMDEIIWLDWHPKGAVLVCGTGDGTVWMWQLPSGRNMAVFTGHTGAVTCGRFLPDGKRLITGSEDGTFMVWDPKSSTPIHRLSNNDGRFRLDGGVTSLAANASSAAAIVGGASGGLRIINLNNGQVVQSLESHEEDSSVEAVAWTAGPAGGAGLWISVGTDKKVKVFEASNGSLRWSAEHDEAVTSLALHTRSTASHISTASVDRSVRTWDLRTGQMVKKHTGHTDVIHSVSVSSDGRHIVTGSDDGAALVYDA